MNSALLLIAGSITGQSIAFSGKVISAQDDTPVPFAHIAIENKPIGTVSNEKGYFELIVESDEIAGSQLIISSVGFKSIKITGAFSWDKTIRLEPLIGQLEEVIVTGKQANLSAKKLVQAAIRSASKIDRGKPIKLNVEQVTHHNNVLTKYYHNKDAEVTRKESTKWNVNISEKYKGLEEYSLDVDALITSTYIFAPEEVLKTDLYSSPKLKKSKGKYSYEFTDIVTFENEELFEISVLQQKDSALGNGFLKNDYKFYISVNDLTLRKLERKEQIVYGQNNHHLYRREHTTTIYDHSLSDDPIVDTRVEFIELITRYDRDGKVINVDRKRDLILGHRTNNYVPYDYTKDKKYTSTLDVLTHNTQDNKLYLFVYTNASTYPIYENLDELYEVLENYTFQEIEVVCIASGIPKSKWKHDVSGFPLFSHYYLKSLELIQANPSHGISLFKGKNLLISSKSVSEKIKKMIAEEIN
ncbi:MAG: carboxypeptidase-like regulatory domain-containing protein [Ekhidna sp.]